MGQLPRRWGMDIPIGPGIPRMHQMDILVMFHMSNMLPYCLVEVTRDGDAAQFRVAMPDGVQPPDVLGAWVAPNTACCLGGFKLLSDSVLDVWHDSGAQSMVPATHVAVAPPVAAHRGPAPRPRPSSHPLHGTGRHHQVSA